MLRASATRCIWPPDNATTGRSAYSDRPIENCLRRSVTSRVAVIGSIISLMRRSLPVAVGLVPLGHPGRVQLHILIELGKPDLDRLGVKTFGIGRRHLQ